MENEDKLGAHPRVKEINKYFGIPPGTVPEIRTLRQHAKKNWGDYLDKRVEHVKDARKKSMHYVQGRPVGSEPEQWWAGANPAFKGENPLSFDEVLDRPIYTQISNKLGESRIRGVDALAGQTFRTDYFGRPYEKGHPKAGMQWLTSAKGRPPNLNFPPQRGMDQTEAEELHHTSHAGIGDRHFSNNYMDREWERWPKLKKDWELEIQKKYNPQYYYDVGMQNREDYFPHSREGREWFHKRLPNLQKRNKVLTDMGKPPRYDPDYIQEALKETKDIYRKRNVPMMPWSTSDDPEGKNIPAPRTTPWKEADSLKFWKQLKDKGSSGRYDTLWHDFIRSDEGKKWLDDQKKNITRPGGFLDTHVQVDPKRKDPSGFPYAPTRMRT